MRGITILPATPITVQGFAAIVLNAKDAIGQHMRWRMLFQFAIEYREPIPVDKLAQIHNASACPIGAWLVSPATRSMRDVAEYGELVRAHLAFHREMTRLAASINDGRYPDALTALSDGSPFQRASQHIANAIMALDRVHAIAIPSRVRPC